MMPRRYILPALLCLSILCLHAGCAHAGSLPLPDLESPLLVGSQSVEPIDIGGDGITDFVSVGRSVFDGTTRLDSPVPVTSHMVHIIVRDREGVWRLRQSFSAGGIVQRLSVVDMNHDGLDDLLLTTRVYPIHTLTCYLQSPDGALVRSGDSVLSETDVSRYPEPVGDDSGRVLVLQTGYSLEGYPLVGQMLQFDRTSGFQSIWTDTLWTAFGNLYPDYARILPTSSGGIVMSPGTRPLGICVGVPMDSVGWGAAFELPVQYRGEDELLILRRDGRSEAWCWLASSIDTLRLMTPREDGEGMSARSIPIAGVTPDSRTNTFNWACARDSIAYFWYTWNGFPEQSFLSVIEVSSRNEAALVSRWPRPSGSPYHMAFDPDERAELVWSGRGGLTLVPAMAGPPNRAPDRAVPIRTVLASADFNGDGFADVVAQIDTTGLLPPVRLLTGLGRPPWFEDAGELGFFDRAEAGCVGDLDGDGDEDVLLAVRNYDDASPMLVPAFWDGVSLRCRYDSRIDVPLGRDAKLYFGDFNGDSRSEVLEAWPGEMMLCSWTADQRPDERIGISTSASTSVVGVGDLDGEQGEEIVTATHVTYSKVRINVRKFDPATGALSDSLANWEAPSGFGLVADLDGRGDLGLYWCGSENAEYVRFEHPTAQPVDRVALPHPLLSGYLEGSAQDIDADGRTDLVIQSVGETGCFEVILDPLGDPWDRVLLLNDEPALHIPVSLQVPGWVDVDRDGDLDLVEVRQDGFYVASNEAVSPGDESPRLLRVRPTSANPCPEEARFAVRLEAGGNVSVELFNAAGRRVRHESRAAPAGGWLEVTADREVGGEPLPSGVYFLRLKANGASVVRRVVFVH